MSIAWLSSPSMLSIFTQNRSTGCYGVHLEPARYSGSRPIDVVHVWLQMTKPAHMVHVHHPLPLDKVILGAYGDYLITSRVEPLSITGACTKEIIAVQWSHISPFFEQVLKDTPDTADNIDIIALGKTKHNGDIWFLKAYDGCGWYTGAGACLTGASSTRSTLTFKYDKPLADDELHCVQKFFSAPDNGAYMVIKDKDEDEDVDICTHLPQSLVDVLLMYTDAYHGVKWLSVGLCGDWFVKFEDGFYLWEGVHPVLDNMLREQHKSLGKPKWVELGHDNTFVAQFELSTTWYGTEDLTAALLSTLELGCLSPFDLRWRRNTKLLGTSWL